MEPAWTTEDDPAICQLRDRLHTFYNDADARYPAFESNAQQDCYWAVVKSALSDRLQATPQSAAIRVLEFGAGRTQFDSFLGDMRRSVHFTTQDVTAKNARHLEAVSDRVHIGDLATMAGQFDIIFSTFVWEHIPSPRTTLDLLLNMLAPGGSLFLFAPRYDVPGYVPPALRHTGTVRRLLLSLRLYISRLNAQLRNRYQFLIVPDPALFHGPWFRDSDAVHLVSRHDLTSYLSSRDLSLRDCWPRRGSMKSTVLERFLKLCVEVRKP